VNISCLFLLHKWDGCKCSRCGSTRNKNHNWDGWKCSRCGRASSEEEARFLKRTTDGDSEYVEARLKESPGLALCKGIQGDTPLHLAAKQGHAPVARLLISHGADVNAKNRVADRPLHLATEGGHQHIAQLLIDRGAKVNVNNQQGDTPLHLAAKGDYAPIAQLLLNKCADGSAKNRLGDTPFNVAARTDSESVGKLFAVALVEPLISGDSDQSTEPWKTLLIVLKLAKSSDSHRVAACLLRSKASVHRKRAASCLARANMFVANHNRIIAQGDTPAGMNKSFAERANQQAQEQNDMAREAELAADSEVALIVESAKNKKPNGGHNSH